MHAQPAAHPEQGGRAGLDPPAQPLDPNLWTETFRTPTWTDYARLKHRPSAADQELGDRLAALHDGAVAPQTVLAIEHPTTRSRARNQPITRVSRP
ncbi:MFS transporter [Ensifer sp. WSM1721]|uniref:MFS transporter n=1 Tax=Ensifer sp. WSM1721 TaxID=1041159 RepID=UPI003523A082